jgi:hypothetical protein
MGNGDDDIMDKRRHHAAISERVASFAELDDAFDALAAIAPKRAPSRREWLAAISSPRDTKSLKIRPVGPLPRSDRHDEPRALN